MSKALIAILAAGALAVAAPLVASSDAVAKKDACRDCIWMPGGPGPGPVVRPHKIRDFAGALALAALNGGMGLEMDSEQLADYAIDVAKRIAYGDYRPDEPVDPEDDLLR